MIQGKITKNPWIVLNEGIIIFDHPKKLIICSVQFMVETANSIQHRSSNLNTVTLLSVVTLILFEVLLEFEFSLYRDIVSSLVKFKYLANDNFFNSTLTSLSLIEQFSLN